MRLSRTGIFSLCFVDHYFAAISQQTCPPRSKYTTRRNGGQFLETICCLGESHDNARFWQLLSLACWLLWSLARPPRTLQTRETLPGSNCRLPCPILRKPPVPFPLPVSTKRTDTAIKRYWSKTRCWCGNLTLAEPMCLSDCRCTHWDENPSVPTPPLSPWIPPRAAIPATKRRLPTARRSPLMMTSIGFLPSPRATLHTKFGNNRSTWRSSQQTDPICLGLG